MTATTHRVQFYEASCHHCRRTFSIPLLGDHSYSQFILHGERGSVFGYLSAYEEPAWEDITARLGWLFTTSRNRADIDRFQRVIAASADPIGGNSNPCGITPVTVKISPSTWIFLPTTPASPPNRRFHHE